MSATTGRRTFAIIECPKCHALLNATVELGTTTEGAAIIGGLAFLTIPCACGRVANCSITFGGSDDD